MHRRATSPAALGRLALARLALVGVALVALAIAGATVALAMTAGRTHPTLSVARSVHVGARTEPITVDARGVAVYELRPETAHHLLCTSSMCLRFWPPVKVAPHARLATAPGVKGRIGTIARHGFRQLTLDGRPLYRYSADHDRRGVASGNGIRAFGGTWHVLRDGRATTAPTTTSSTTTSSTTTTSYPGY